MEYEEKLSMDNYLDFIKSVLEECYRVLKRGGRICWNVPNQIRVGRDGALWPPAIKTAGLMEKTGFSFFDFIIWDQGYSDSATAWGSWCSPSAPFIRHQTEAILVFYKDVWKIQHKGKTDLTKKEFMSLTKGELWRMNPERRRAHPAPFPE
jgi:site-specific DNA-methyltransferase (adenine-specific)